MSGGDQQAQAPMPALLQAVVTRLGWPALIGLWLLASSGGWADVLIGVLLGVPGAALTPGPADAGACDEVRDELVELRAEFRAEVEHARAMRSAQLAQVAQIVGGRDD